MAIPVKCLACSNIWPSRAFAGLNASATLVGNREGPCPACGGTGEIMNGAYHFDHDGIARLTSGPRESFDAFSTLWKAMRRDELSAADASRLASVLKDRQKGKLSASEAEAKAKEISSSFASAWRGQEAAWISLVVALLIFFAQMKGSNDDHNELMAALHAQYELQLEQTELSREQVQTLKTIVQGSIPPTVITAPPDGHRTKRQRRRDRRFGM